MLERELAHGVELLLGVVGEGVDRDDRVQPERPRDAEMPLEVRDAASLEVAVGPVVLERADGRDEDDRARHELARARDDVEELLHPEIGREAALGHDEVGELEPHARRDERAVAVRDVRERPAVDERRAALRASARGSA